MRFIKYALLTLAALVMMGSAYILIANPTINIEVPQKQVQLALEKKLPFTHQNKGLHLTIKKGAHVAFSEENGITLQGDIIIKPSLTKKTHYEGNVNVSTNLIYHKNAFYLSDATLNNLQGEWVLSERAQSATKILAKLVARAQQSLDIKPKNKESILLGAKEIFPNFLSKRLESIPVYKLEKLGWKGFLADKTLSDVQIIDNNIKATLSLRSFVTWLLFSLGAAVFAIVTVVGIVIGGGRGTGILMVGALIGGGTGN